MSAVSGDLLSASSLLTAVLGMLYSVWYAEIREATTTPIPSIDAGREQADTMQVLRTRAVPLFVIAVLLVLLLAWPAWKVVYAAAQHLLGVRHGGQYDPVQACFIAVFAVLLVLAWTLGTAARRVFMRWQQLKAVPNS